MNAPRLARRLLLALGFFTGWGMFTPAVNHAPAAPFDQPETRRADGALVCCSDGHHVLVWTHPGSAAGWWHWENVP